MKLLILGSKGMLGRQLVNEFNHGQAEVFDWDREEIDIANKNQVEEKIGSLRPEIIINAAAYNNVDKAENEERALAMKVNAEAVGYLAETAQSIGAIFVHYSTDYVFKGDRVEGYKEDDEPDPQSWYAKSKYEGERRLLSFRAERSRVEESPQFYLIRTSRLFGPPGAGEVAKKSFVDLMIDLVKNQGKKELDLVDEEVSSPTYAVDLAKATRELIESGCPSGIYHRANDGAHTWYGWAKKIFELAGLEVKLNPVAADKFPRPAARPKYSILLNTKLPAMRRWEEALAEYQYLK